MRMERRGGYRVVIGGPVPPQADAITLGKTIFVRKSAAGHQGLLAHELVHVRQFAELGPLRFVLRYVGSYLGLRLSGYRHMAAYRRIPLEVEASWVSRLHHVSDLEPAAINGASNGAASSLSARRPTTSRRSRTSRTTRTPTPVSS